MFWSSQMSYFDIVNSFKDLESFQRPMTQYHYNCVERSLEADKLTAIFYERYSGLTPFIKKSIRQVLAKRIAQRQRWDQDLPVHSPLLSDSREQTRSWLLTLVPIKNIPIRYSAVLTIIKKKIQSGAFDKILLNAEQSRYQERQRERIYDSKIPNTPPQSLNAVKKDFLNHLAFRQEDWYSKFQEGVNVLLLLYYWIEHIAPKDTQEEAWELLILGFDDARTSYHAHEQKFIPEKDYACPKGYEEQLLDTGTLFRQRAEKTHYHPVDHPEIALVEPYIKEVGGAERYASDDLYSLYCQAMSYGLREIEEYYYEPCFQIQSTSYQQSLSQWKHYQIQKGQELLKKTSKRNFSQDPVSLYEQIKLDYLKTITKDSPFDEKNFIQWSELNKIWEIRFQQQLHGLAQIGRPLNSQEITWGWDKLLGQPKMRHSFEVLIDNVHHNQEIILEKMIAHKVFLSADHGKLVLSILREREQELEIRAMNQELFSPQVQPPLWQEISHTLDDLFQQRSYWSLVPQNKEPLILKIKSLLKLNTSDTLPCSQDALHHLFDDLWKRLNKKEQVVLLRVSSKIGYASIVKKILERGSKIAKTKSGSLQQTALIAAASAGHVHCLKELLTYPCALDAQDERGYTALMRAAEEKHPDCIHLLLDKGANWKIKNKTGSIAPLMSCARDDAQSLKLFMEKGFKDSFLYSDSQKRTISLITFSILSHSLQCLKLLVSSGADIEFVDSWGLKALAVAAAQGDYEAAKILIEAGAEISYFDQHFFSFWKPSSNQLKVYDLIQKEFHLQSSILKAISWARLDLNRYSYSEKKLYSLIRYKTDIQHQNQSFSIFYGKIRLDEQAARHLLFQALEQEYLSIVSFYSSNQLNSYQNDAGETALIVAARRGNPEMVKQLLFQGALPEVKGQGGVTPLMIALLTRHRDCVQIFLEYQTKTDFWKDKDEQGYSIWDYADLSQDSKMKSLLLEAGAPVQINNHSEHQSLESHQILLFQSSGFEKSSNQNNRHTTYPLSC